MVQVHIDSDPDDAELPPAYTLEGRPTPNPAGSANIGLGQDANVFGTGGPPSPSQQNIAPPSDAQRALAPLQITRTNDAIKGKYLVNISENKCGPDVLLKSTNGAVRSHIYIEGSVPRVCEIQIATTNAAIQVAVPKRPVDQPVAIKAASTNGECKSTVSLIASLKAIAGQVSLALPPDFAGIVKVASTNGKITLHPSLQATSVIIPNQAAESSRTTTYRVARQSHFTGTVEDKSTASAATGDDTCTVQTTNSKINVSFYDPSAAESQSQSDSSCLMM
ncbi:hypothetical protein EMMF5_002936 [Cystobasidiomycetes sp. EMM_F5]